MPSDHLVKTLKGSHFDMVYVPAFWGCFVMNFGIAVEGVFDTEEGTKFT